MREGPGINNGGGEGWLTTLIEDAGQRLSAAPPGAGQPLPALSSPLASANLEIRNH